MAALRSWLNRTSHFHVRLTPKYRAEQGDGLGDRKQRGRVAARVEEVQAAFTSNYQAYQYRFVEFFIEHLSDVSRSFRGDLQAMIVLALVGQVYLRAVRAAIRAGHDPRDLPAERLGITASRIADVTSIPRETVRRKLDGLEQRGWILRNPDGSWRLAVADGDAAARTDLADLDARGIERVARLFCDLETLVAAHAPVPQGDTAPREGAQSGQAPPSR